MSLRFNNIDIVVIDYGMGNLRSVQNALIRFGVNVNITNDLSKIIKSDALVLPGVGAFGEAISNLQLLKIIDPIKDQILSNKKPILGICLGMQLLAESSEEKGNHQGLGLIEGTVKKIKTLENHRLPHIGWNDIKVMKKKPLFNKIISEDAFYFVHSYEFKASKKYISSYTDYGKGITASVQKNNIFGVQFHPEKSQTAGLIIIRNFLNYVEQSMKNLC
jgi:imidazole glycerol-phosphate synthase subunit HisH